MCINHVYASYSAQTCFNHAIPLSLINMMDHVRMEGFTMIPNFSALMRASNFAPSPFALEQCIALPRGQTSPRGKLRVLNCVRALFAPQSHSTEPSASLPSDKHRRAAGVSVPKYHNQTPACLDANFVTQAEELMFALQPYHLTPPASASAASCLQSSGQA